MPRDLSPIEKDLARSAPLLNAKFTHGKLVLNAPGGEAYWGVRIPGEIPDDHVPHGKNLFWGIELLSPEAAVAKSRGSHLVWGAARGHTIPWADTTPDDCLLIGGADTHDDTMALIQASEDVAAWLGYKDRFEYAEACEQFPEDVARRIKEAPG